MNYYDLLGVPKNADAETIKKAFRKAARRAHPDVTHDDGSRMAELNDAKAVLTDQSRRRAYDAGGTGESAMPIDDAALHAIMETISQALDHDGDLVHLVRTGFEHRLRELRMANVADRTRIERYLRTRAKVKAKAEGGRNFFHMVIDSRVASLRSTVAAREHMEKIVSRAIELMGSQQWLDEQLYVTFGAGGHGTTTTTTGGFR